MYNFYKCECLYRNPRPRQRSPLPFHCVISPFPSMFSAVAQHLGRTTVNAQNMAHVQSTHLEVYTLIKKSFE